MDEKKVREAIKYFKIMLFDMEGMGFKYIPKYYEIAIEALEKQLPKKTIDKSCVKDNDTIYGYVGICPSCNGIVDDSMIVCDCTQVLDWSE
ncbi:hypothetical protein [Mediterraneibacter gnavus]|uniref:hypothetical protein n=1 Tax=Mediterraneibacter gnavus TaxID=33038 RepID=UPI0004653907|nr:hypothetical protein [Mediterraneibacter gnavus]